MKPKAWVVVILFGLTLLSSSAWAVFRLFDDFEDELAGPLDEQDGWQSGGGDNRVAADPADAGNQVLYVPSESSIVRKSLRLEHTGVPDATARMLFMRIRVSRKQTFSVGLSPLTYPNEFSDFAPEIGMSNSAANLDLRVWDDDGGNYEILARLAPDRWYNLWVYVDASLNQYEIWLNDVPDANAVEADKLAAPDLDETFEFRSGDNSDLRTFYIKTAGGASGINFGPVYFDDIYIELGGGRNLANPRTLDEPIPGDADRNGCVNWIDFSALAASWQSGPEPAASWEQGNFDYNDAVDCTDLHLMAQYWLWGCSGAMAESSLQ